MADDQLANAQGVDSQLNTVNVPVIGTPAPAPLYRAAKVPLRVVVRNVGGVVLLLSFDAGTLTQPPALANTFQLPVGASETFVLMPKQTLLAAGAGAGGVASIAISEALPRYWMES